MIVWRHNVSLETQCVPGDTMCDWKHNVFLETQCVSKQTLRLQIRILCPNANQTLLWLVRASTRTEERLGAIGRDEAIGRDGTIRII